MARLRMRDGGGVLRTIVRIRARDTDGTLRTIQQVRARDGAGAIRTVYSPLTVTVSPGSVSAYGSSGAAATLTTAPAAASAAGGTGPYTYAWTQIGVSGYSWTINAPAAASTTFSAAAVDPGNVANATFQCAATDAAGNTAIVQITAFANNGQPYNPDTGITGGGAQGGAIP